MADRYRVVLVSPRNPLNIGAAARAMSNFGVTRLRLVNPYDKAYGEAKSAVNSRYILEQAEVFDSLPAAIADCQLVAGTTAAHHRDLHLPLYRLEAAAALIHSHPPPIALVFGSEKFGLSNDDLSHCNWILRIPTRSEHGSMNLGQAVAICLYELHRNGTAAGERFPAAEVATAGDYDRIADLLREILEHSGYVNTKTAESSEQKLRRLVRRLQLPASDATTWLGILRQVLWRARGNSPE